MITPALNKSLAEKLHSIQVFANGYKLKDIGPEGFWLDNSAGNDTLYDSFTPEELADPWVQIRPSDGPSTFHLRFTSTTPRRMHGHQEMCDAGEH